MSKAAWLRKQYDHPSANDNGYALAREAIEYAEELERERDERAASAHNFAGLFDPETYQLDCHKRFRVGLRRWLLGHKHEEPANPWVQAGAMLDEMHAAEAGVVVGSAGYSEPWCQVGQTIYFHAPTWPEAIRLAYKAWRKETTNEP